MCLIRWTAFHVQKWQVFLLRGHVVTNIKARARQAVAFQHFASALDDVMTFGIAVVVFEVDDVLPVGESGHENLGNALLMIGSNGPWMAWVMLLQNMPNGFHHTVIGAGIGIDTTIDEIMLDLAAVESVAVINVHRGPATHSSL